MKKRTDMKKRFIFIARIDGEDEIVSFHTTQDAAEKVAERFIENLDTPDGEYTSDDDSKFLIAEVRAEANPAVEFNYFS